MSEHVLLASMLSLRSLCRPQAARKPVDSAFPELDPPGRRVYCLVVEATNRLGLLCRRNGPEEPAPNPIDVDSRGRGEYRVVEGTLAAVRSHGHCATGPYACAPTAPMFRKTSRECVTFSQQCVPDYTIRCASRLFRRGAPIRQTRTTVAASK